MVALTNKLEEQLAAQNIRHNQAIAKMLEKITQLFNQVVAEAAPELVEADAGHGCQKEIGNPHPTIQTAKKGWKDYNKEGRPSNHSRGKTNLGGYCWTQLAGLYKYRILRTPYLATQPIIARSHENHSCLDWTYGYAHIRAL